jgi:hypothetical protein
MKLEIDNPVDGQWGFGVCSWNDTDDTHYVAGAAGIKVKKPKRKLYFIFLFWAVALVLGCQDPRIANQKTNKPVVHTVIYRSEGSDLDVLADTSRGTTCYIYRGYGISCVNDDARR